MNKKTIMQTTLAAMVAVGLAGVTTQAVAAKAGFEKCYGVVKKAMNDCGTAKHACAGQSKVTGQGDEWIYMPKGTCDKLVNGSTKKS